MEPTMGYVSGCLEGTVCNRSLPYNSEPIKTVTNAISSQEILQNCTIAYQKSVDFAGNYTALLVALHNVFNGQPDTLQDTLMQMYKLKTMAQDLMDMPDPRFNKSIMGIGPPWQYILNKSQYEHRDRQAYPSAFLH